MIPFPASLALLPAALLAGAVYVRLGWARPNGVRTVGRVLLVAATWAAPLGTEGPGAAQLTLGLLAGFIGIRMVALGERYRGRRAPPGWGEALAALATPEELLAAPTGAEGTRPRGATAAVLRGTAGLGACVLLLWAGNHVRLWRWSRLLDDLLVLGEVAVGAAGVHQLIVGVAGWAGRPVKGLQDRPHLSTSLSQFWGRRWNRLVQGNLHHAFFRPRARRGGAGGRAGVAAAHARGTVAAFAASGIMHVIAVLDAGPPAVTLGPAAAVMGFFLLHAGLVLGERTVIARGDRYPEGSRARAWARVRTAVVFVLLSPLLLDPFACVTHVHGRALGGP